MAYLRAAEAGLDGRSQFEGIMRYLSERARIDVVTFERKSGVRVGESGVDRNVDSACSDCNRVDSHAFVARDRGGNFERQRTRVVPSVGE